MKKIFVLSMMLILSMTTTQSVWANFTDKYISEQKESYLNFIEYIPAILNWNLKGGGVTVAVIDDGVWQEHEDLLGQNWVNVKEVAFNNIDDDNNGYIDDYHGWNFVDADSNLAPKGSHATAVAGIIAARENDLGISGIAPEAKIMSLIACGNSGCSTKSVIEAIRYAVNNGAKVINLSLGGNGYVGYNVAYDAAIKYAYDNNVVVVAAAGNGDPSGAGTAGQNLDFIKVSPVSNETDFQNMVIGAGALANQKVRARWSNYGPRYVDVWAPGQDILTLSVPLFDDGVSYGYLSGTSFSAPMVSASVALLRAKYPLARNYEIIDMILSSLTVDGALNVKNVATVIQGSCKIPGVRLNVNNGDKVVINAEHLNS